ncbi:MAG TPA: Fic/DOC family N-terminal domain-containing protein [Candidatus Nanopelagicales bacterium]|nr:Fic/DOC family N-terminal domain-containing protein [Candidatus Nanopelagicales bacterium]
MRAGRFVQQPTGYIAFEPAPLPPEPPVQLGVELARFLSAADLALGRLDGITQILPNPDLFVAMYVRQEAVLSSQIEGTQASLTDVLQFEAGEPFLDGNGRVGRLLITLLLCQRDILSRPLLYLSHFLKQNRTEYYDRLQAVRAKGAWEEWLAFFLRGVRDVATQAQETARKILDLRSRYQDLLQREGKAAATLLRALDVLFAQPVLTPAFAPYLALFESAAPATGSTPSAGSGQP